MRQQISVTKERLRAATKTHTSRTRMKRRRTIGLHRTRDTMADNHMFLLKGRLGRKGDGEVMVEGSWQEGWDVDVDVSCITTDAATASRACRS